MQVKEGPLPGLMLITPKVWGDARGSFYELFKESVFQELGLPTLVQDNVAHSALGILRGLHFQCPPSAQGKLVTVFYGSVLDVVVDIRRGSPTYGQHFSLQLDAENPVLLWVPPGFAHGYEVLSDRAIFFYKVSSYYAPADEKGLPWNDPHLGIAWHSSQPTLSERDRKWAPFQHFESPFHYTP